MYAKIKDNEAVEYPLTEGDLEGRFPDLKFPLDTNNIPVPEGYVRVEPSELPEESVFHKVVEGMPVLEGGLWKQTWIQVPLTQEELEVQKARITQRLLGHRRAALKESDWTQLPDVPLSEEVKQLWRVYRQALRDLPSQPNFPLDIAVPQPPLPPK